MEHKLLEQMIKLWRNESKTSQKSVFLMQHIAAEVICPIETLDYRESREEEGARATKAAKGVTITIIRQEMRTRNDFTRQ